MRYSLDHAQSAESALSAYWNNAIPVDPVIIAKAMGVSVYSSKSIDYCGEFFIQNKKPTILYKPSGKTQEDRFVIAHELGHFVLHHTGMKKDQISSFKIDIPDSNEREANEFAINLLTPESAVRFAVRKAGLTSVEKLSSYFDAYETVVRFRLKSAGLI